MNKRNTFKLCVAVTIHIAIATGSLANPLALAREQDDLYQLCSRFPLNSRCDGYKVPISLKTREGEKAKCLLNGAEKAKACKVVLTENALSAYIESGDRLKVLGNARNTTQISIPLATIRSFNYSEKSKINVGAVLALGVWGLLAKNRTATFGIQYSPEMTETDEIRFAPQPSAEPQNQESNDPARTPLSDETETHLSELTSSQSEAESSSSQQFLFVIQRKKGRKMRQSLEKSTGLTARMFSIDE
ncbi:hypothetical protein [Acaryochloris sp. IP29b_bin.137]|uniref:hypothetical protein n=1 Tax=Acaryochloris sp. IP29b_bin.137 TaxID=2969217 RepID=UPI002608913D|nr:hypothetical protein [Acaryochloris sp. IP29b_bin.137]